MSDKGPLPPQKKRRNLAVLLALLLFVAVVYGVTIVKIHLGAGHEVARQ
ncbi:MAG TPA: hypothetical protein VHB73_02595 [Alphaproteobacteria bacterium]|nr:hypothetical protein [Alphaproteobacteria bacterium]